MIPAIEFGIFILIVLGWVGCIIAICRDGDYTDMDGNGDVDDVDLMNGYDDEVV